MGVGASSFPDNDSLVDSVVEEGDFSPEVERVLRLVDRSSYAVGPSAQIYCDSAWRVDRLHLSAPSIYALVLRELNIRPGQSVLNIGSGTGYLSTMLGLLLGKIFLNFCPPQFTAGNIFSLVPPIPDSPIFPSPEIPENPQEVYAQLMANRRAELTQFLSSADIDPPPFINRNETDAESDFQYWPTYDRIYVGAMVSSINQLKAILRLLNVGGRLIAPMFDHLLRIDRVTETFFTDTVLSSVNFVGLAQLSYNEPVILPFPRREIERLDVLACRAFRRELRRVIIQRHGGQLPSPPRYVSPRERRHKQPPPQPPFTGSSPPSPPPADNPAPSTSHAAGGSPRGSTSTAPSASNFSPSVASSFSPGMSSTYHHSLLTDSEMDNGIGGGYDDSDELDGVRPFTYPNSPQRFSRQFPTHPPSEVPQPQSTEAPVTPGVGILGGNTIDVDMTGSSNTTTFEQMHFIEMISRHFLYCHIPHFRNRLLRGLNAEEEGDKEEDASQLNSESSFDSDRASYGDSDQVDSDEEEEDREAGEGHIVEGEGGDGEHKASDSSPRTQSTGHSSRISQRNKRRKREGITDESTGHDSSNEHDSGTRRKEAKRRVHHSRDKKDRPKVWRKQSYLFQEEMRRLLEEMKNEMHFSEYVVELVLKIN
nr:protein l isoaspartate o methyltransferase [Hymenolepis microstoma]